MQTAVRSIKAAVCGRSYLVLYYENCIGTSNCNFCDCYCEQSRAGEPVLHLSCCHGKHVEREPSATLPPNGIGSLKDSPRPNVVNCIRHV